MKKITCLLAGLAMMAISTTAMAASDRPITVAELPAAAQQFLKAHFSGVEVSYAKVDEDLLDKDYQVIFVNGSKVEFAKDGQWKDIECKASEVPAALIPKPIAAQIAKQFAGRKVTELDRTKRGYEVKLDNGQELNYDRNFKLVKLDD